jgi:hypothetical protein
MLHTSYFSKVKTMPPGLNLVCIARTLVPGFNGKVCGELMPSSQLLWDYKKGKIGEEEYRYFYKKQLRELDAKVLIDKYGDDATFICWEGKDKFCHRHLVADWLRDAGYEINEYG